MNTRNIITKDGRNLCINETGVPDGVPVLVHHGTPESGLMYKDWIEDAETQGIRLIGYDRPGYGDSSPHPERSVADAVEDVAASRGPWIASCAALCRTGGAAL